MCDGTLYVGILALSPTKGISVTAVAVTLAEHLKQHKNSRYFLDIFLYYLASRFWRPDDASDRSEPEHKNFGQLLELWQLLSYKAMHFGKKISTTISLKITSRMASHLLGTYSFVGGGTTFFAYYNINFCRCIVNISHYT